MIVIADTHLAWHALPMACASDQHIQVISGTVGRPRHIVMMAFPEAKMLDVSGPLDIFSSAVHLLNSRCEGPLAYTVEVVAETSGPLTTSSGVRLMAEHALAEVALQHVDTLMVAGGIGVESLLHNAAVLCWLADAAGRVRRIAAVCTWAFVLAAAGLLDGRRATTHWRHAQRLAQQYTTVAVEPDAIFVKDGHVYTSAGVTAGMDLALALVEEDLGHDMGLAVARECVMFLKRPGGQSQFSAYLMLQNGNHTSIRDVQSWILEHLAADLSVDALAAHVAMSPRNFARVFKREAQTTPARFVEMARVQAARRCLEGGWTSVEAIASACGFGNAEHLRRAFVRCYRVSPQEYRQRFRA